MCLVKGKCCAGREERAGQVVLPVKYIQYSGPAVSLGSRSGHAVSLTRIFLPKGALESLEHSKAFRVGVCWVPERV